MKKHLIIGLLFLTFISSIKAQNVEILSNYWKKQYLKGNVKSLKETSYKAYKWFGKIKKKKAIEFIFIIRDSLENVYICKDNDSYFSQIRDTNGNQTEYSFLSNDMYERYNYKYDEKGGMLEEKIVSSFGIKINKSYCIYKYDDKKNLIELKEYNCLDSTLITRGVNSYNKNNVLIERNFYMGYNDSIPYNTVRFDSLGRLIELITSDGYRIMSTYSVKYNENGNILEEDQYHEKKIYKYDDFGNIKEENVFNWDGSFSYSIINQYEYDKNNNWIKCITYNKNKLCTVKEREIEYAEYEE